MAEFRIHTLEDAPAESQPALRNAQDLFGFIPNLQGVMAEAPGLLAGYMALWDVIDRTSSFSSVEQNLLFLAVSLENECPYCVSGHTGFAKLAGVPMEHLEAMRAGKPIADQRLESLRRFSQEVLRRRGWVAEKEVDQFLAAGFTHRQVLEVILTVGFKIMSNYTNHIANTPLDVVMKAYAWPKEEAGTAK